MVTYSLQITVFYVSYCSGSFKQDFWPSSLINMSHASWGLCHNDFNLEWYFAIMQDVSVQETSENILILAIKHYLIVIEWNDFIHMF